jgi:hypothetical protein
VKSLPSRITCNESGKPAKLEHFETSIFPQVSVFPSKVNLPSEHQSFLSERRSFPATSIFSSNTNLSPNVNPCRNISPSGI